MYPTLLIDSTSKFGSLTEYTRWALVAESKSLAVTVTTKLYIKQLSYNTDNNMGNSGVTNS